MVCSTLTRGNPGDYLSLSQKIAKLRYFHKKQIEVHMSLWRLGNAHLIAWSVTHGYSEYLSEELIQRKNDLGFYCLLSVMQWFQKTTETIMHCCGEWRIILVQIISSYNSRDQDNVSQHTMQSSLMRLVLRQQSTKHSRAYIIIKFYFCKSSCYWNQTTKIVLKKTFCSTDIPSFYFIKF